MTEREPKVTAADWEKAVENAREGIRLQRRSAVVARPISEVMDAIFDFLTDIEAEARRIAKERGAP